MRQKNNFTIKSTLKRQRYYKSFVVATGAFLFAFIFASIFTPVQTSDATQQVSTTVAYGESGSLTIISPDVSMNVTASAAGTYASGSSSVNIYTDANQGYQLYISLPDASADGRLYLGGDTTSSFIYAASGSFDSPAVLAANSWGYALKQSDIDYLMSLNDSVTQTSSFSNSYNVVDSSSLWAAIPTYGSPQIIYQEDSATSASGTDLDVYYGVYANAALPSGTYTGSVLFTAIADDTSETVDALAVYPTEVSTYWETITLKTAAITTSLEDLGPVKAYVGKSTTDKMECINESVGITDGYITVTCAVPIGYNYQNSTYNVWLVLEDYNKTLLLENGLTYASSMASASWPDTTYSTVSSCSELEYGGMGSLNNYNVYRLKDGNCWQMSDYTTVAWASRSCPSGFNMPAQGTFNTLLSNVGSGSQLYNLGWSGNYWSGTERSTSYSAYSLGVSAGSASVSSYVQSSSYHIRCYAL